jgi:hypothetical protein
VRHPPAWAGAGRPLDSMSPTYAGHMAAPRISWSVTDPGQMGGAKDSYSEAEAGQR